ncbi:8-amino-7-oxononanoate synthase [Photobacterium sp.]|uniref:8-amino-7-oxononanoate synthase n=1 Tax=Photobacterium sp. TaxID=660 RepID=UPI00299E0189|nr:8-amino-7-oxononanoate synthase [Photobacterium sp.]MDX1301865.1 8-amino-7-oxononanoate synthase [Photobacterium sp.]
MICSTMRQFNRSFNQKIEQALAERKAQGLYRQRACLSRNRQRVQAQGQSLVNFSSNDYLGLAQDPALLAAWQEGLTRYGTGSGASPLVTGFHPAHQELEVQLADWLGYDRALLFNSGFSANQAVLFTLPEKNDLLLQDKLNHASLMEAGMLSPATMRRFAHNDIAALSGLLTKSGNGKTAVNADKQAATPLVITEGVFSMDGDLSPLAEMAQLCRQHDSWLMVDDAHGCGVLGEQGRGSCAYADVKADILVITFGKAFGLSGAAVLCDENTAEYLIQFARHFIYSTAMPPAQAYALSTACRLIQQGDWRREKLQELSHHLAARLDSGIGFVDTLTPIKPLLIGDSEQAVAASQALKERGVWVSAIRPPTVPVNSARLRITLTAAHTLADIECLTTTLNEVIHG